MYDGVKSKLFYNFTVIILYFKWWHDRCDRKVNDFKEGVLWLQCQNKVENVWTRTALAIGMLTWCTDVLLCTNSPSSKGSSLSMLLVVTMTTKRLPDSVSKAVNAMTICTSHSMKNLETFSLYRTCTEESQTNIPTLQISWHRMMTRWLQMLRMKCLKNSMTWLMARMGLIDGNYQTSLC